MFAGLPGIGVGTLFYVLVAMWMPIRELPAIVRGRSSWARCRVIGTQFVFAAGIIASVAFADRVLAWIMGAGTPRAVGPARWLNDQLGVHAPKTILAAPVTASLILLAAILTTVELVSLIRTLRSRRRQAAPPLASGNESILQGQ